jgi:hypothetical protein
MLHLSSVSQALNFLVLRIGLRSALALGDKMALELVKWSQGCMGCCYRGLQLLRQNDGMRGGLGTESVGSRGASDSLGPKDVVG